MEYANISMPSRTQYFDISDTDWPAHAGEVPRACEESSESPVNHYTFLYNWLPCFKKNKEPDTIRRARFPQTVALAARNTSNAAQHKWTSLNLSKTRAEH